MRKFLLFFTCMQFKTPYKTYYFPQQFLYFFPEPHVEHTPVFIVFMVFIILLLFPIVSGLGLLVFIVFVLLLLL